ncbi:MAG: cyclopropane-fatty-acyl-phospholipid synthase family protein [bacterium]|nr:cyclopropane-fatty-acyl-phospholipid synthase family protein [bacterium]
MSEILLDSAALITQSGRTPLIIRFLRQKFIERLSRISIGTLTVIDPNGTYLLGSDHSIRATLHINNLEFYRKVAVGGTIGAADAYIDGLWKSDDLVSLIRLFIRNRAIMDRMEGGLAWIGNAIFRLTHRKNRNTIDGSKANILAHYDIGNEFYQLMLDETMAYSSAVFLSPDSTLTEASTEKFDRLCRKLDLKPQDQVIEIGTGWGGFAIHAASKYGCKVTTTTISAEQYQYAKAAVERAGLTGQITLLNQDYRLLTGTFDKLVSIEMIEAVGAEYIGEFVEKCSRLLKPDGLMTIKVIASPDQHFDEYRKRADFIQSHIFPGSCLVSIAHLLENVKLKTNLRLLGLEDITLHYARTLNEWNLRFQANRSRVSDLGYPDSFQRMWEYYLAYCEAGFRERFIGNVQLMFAKPENRLDPVTMMQEK